MGEMPKISAFGQIFLDPLFEKGPYWQRQIVILKFFFLKFQTPPSNFSPESQTLPIFKIEVALSCLNPIIAPSGHLWILKTQNSPNQFLSNWYFLNLYNSFCPGKPLPLLSSDFTHFGNWHAVMRNWVKHY